MPAQVKLTTADNEEFLVDAKIAKMSKTVAGLMEALNMDDEEAEGAAAPIPLPTVTKEVLEKVIEWCEHHQNDEPLVEEADDGKEKDTTVGDWDKTFLEVEFRLLTEMMKAANYLDVRGLFLTIAKTIANMIKECKTAQQVRDKFHIYKDLTDEEEERIRKENSWCDE